MLPEPPIGRPAGRTAYLAALGVLCAGCASRSVPASFPPSSASSDKAGEAPPAMVTVSLDTEPHADRGPAEKNAIPPIGAGHHGGGAHGH